eukprot:m.77337 g.77337  ORF g.77337 m.77337 type:complete len:189 (+) comp11913_c0_seq3:66-632(+)
MINYCYLQLSNRSGITLMYLVALASISVVVWIVGAVERDDLAASLENVLADISLLEEKTSHAKMLDEGECSWSFGAEKHSVVLDCPWEKTQNKSGVSLVFSTLSNELSNSVVELGASVHGIPCLFDLKRDAVGFHATCTVGKEAFGTATSTNYENGNDDSVNFTIITSKPLANGWQHLVRIAVQEIDE